MDDLKNIICLYVGDKAKVNLKHGLKNGIWGFKDSSAGSLKNYNGLNTLLLLATGSRGGNVRTDFDIWNTYKLNKIYLAEVTSPINMNSGVEWPDEKTMEPEERYIWRFTFNIIAELDNIEVSKIPFDISNAIHYSAKARSRGKLLENIDYTVINELFRNVNFESAVSIDEGITGSEGNIGDGLLEENDLSYVDSVNLTEVINEERVQNAHVREPRIEIRGSKKYYTKNPKVGKLAIKNAGCLCENENSHETFTSVTETPFMEAHHLIPMYLVEDMWGRFNVNIDCCENIVSLCPTCHRKIHYAKNEEKLEIIEKLFNLKKDELHSIGIDISVEDLNTFYKL